MSSFPEVRLIQNQQKVDEVDTNKPIYDLIDRTNYLKGLMDTLVTQSAKVFITDAPCTNDCIDSNAVYFDDTEEKWNQAYAAVIETDGSLEEIPAPQSYMQGVIMNISGSAGSRIGDVYFSGLIPSVNVVNFIEQNEIRPGEPLYLTGRPITQGQLTYTPPTVEIFCGKFIDNDAFLLTPDHRNLGEHHKHIWFELEHDKFTKVAPTVALSGTLTFANGSALVSAASGAFTTELAIGDWIFLDSDSLSVKVLYITDNDNLELYSVYSGTGGAGAASIDDGHWVYPYTEFPVWPPMSYTSGVMMVNGVVYFQPDYFYVTADGVHYISTEYPPSGDIEQFQAIFFYVAPWASDRDAEAVSGVESLFSETLNLKIYRQGTTTPASAGNLAIRCIPTFFTRTNAEGGSLVVKRLSADILTGNIDIYRGEVVDRLFAGNANVTLTEHGGVGAAETGPIDISVAQQFGIIATNTVGWEVFKSIALNPTTGLAEIRTGPVLENLYPLYSGAPQNVFLTPHIVPDLHAFTNTARLDLAIKQTVDSTTYVADSGNIVVKNVETSADGNIVLRRGPVVESILPANGRVAVYEEGTTTPASQGSLDIDVKLAHIITFLHTGSLETPPSVDVWPYMVDGARPDALLYEDSVVVQVMARITGVVAAGQLDIAVYTKSPDTIITGTSLSLISGSSTSIYAKSAEILPSAGTLITAGQKIGVRLTASSFSGVPQAPDDIYTIEIKLLVVRA